ncbi:mercuric ion binding protein [Enhydrobacter aerosaccus]|uniref:Mercuric ion binding protein n=1 Tax=Enhydrobacter aerosaccus TaxID=225324 RepID=A0A1T4S9T8_9HYPH|nr:mercury transporter [Enhydrobacter aerosaccus]SKA25070.1 mercuric ion binding protein [Enhydrobacter aerosaccus]
MKSLSIAALAATALSANMAAAAERTVTLDVANATCELCGPIVKRALNRVPGVLDVQITQKEESALAKVRFDDSRASTAALITATTNAGYPSHVEQ